MLTELHCRNFKSWRKLDSMELAPITGLFGANSSGKTSLLQILLMMKQTVESPDRAQVLNFGDERSPVALGTYRDILFGHEPEEGLEFAISWALPEQLKIDDPDKARGVLFSGDRLRFQAKVQENGKGKVFVKEFSYRFADHDFGMRRREGRSGKYDLLTEPLDFPLKRTQGRPWALPAPVKCYGFPDQVKAYYQNAGFLSDLELQFAALFSRTYYLGPLREYPKRQYSWAGDEPEDMGERGERAIHALLASRDRGRTISRGRGRPLVTLEELVAQWLRKLRMIQEFKVELIAKGSSLYRVHVKKSPKAPDVLITDVGFGVSQILPVVALCYYVPEGSTILLEQPEIHLHPSVQAGLADVLIDAVKTRGVQIVLESHSEHLLLRLQRRIAEQQGLSEKNVALYFCDSRAGESRIRRLQMDMYGDIVNWPDEFFGDAFGEVAAKAKAALDRKRAIQK